MPSGSVNAPLVGSRSLGLIYGRLGTNDKPQSHTTDQQMVRWSWDGPSMVLSLRAVTVKFKGELVNSPHVQKMELKVP